MYPLNSYEIWIGYYHLGDGVASIAPQMVSAIFAPSFKVACLLYELRSKLESIESMIQNDNYVDPQSCRWFYNFDTNSNDWTGKYFETEKEAKLSFIK